MKTALKVVGCVSFFWTHQQARPVASKSNPLINAILKKNPTMHMQKHWDFNRRRIALLNRAGWQIGWFWLHIHWEISLHADLIKQIKRCIYSLAPCLCNAITLAASALTIHKMGAGRPLIDVSRGRVDEPCWWVQKNETRPGMASSKLVGWYTHYCFLAYSF